ncbi:MAG: peptidylprolyl isomerase [Eubacteriales bacterium]
MAEVFIKDYGVIKIRLFPNIAPKAVENFTSLSEKGYYNGVIFHRVIKDFMIQGGDPTGTGAGGESIWGEPFEDEFAKDAFPYRGALCMANAGPNTNGSQFFIVQLGDARDDFIMQMENSGFPEDIINKYKKYGGTPWLYRRHTVFGQVVSGMDVVDAIAKVEVESPQTNKPIKDIIIENVKIC